MVWHDDCVAVQAAVWHDDCVVVRVVGFVWQDACADVDVVCVDVVEDVAVV